VAAHETAPDPHPQYTTTDAVVTLISGALEDIAFSLDSKQDIATAGDVNARVAVQNDGTLVAARRAINLIAGPGVSLTIVDDDASEAVDITIGATGGGAPALFAQPTEPTFGVDPAQWWETDGGGALKTLWVWSP
jgi:hypothetical protein